MPGIIADIMPRQLAINWETIKALVLVHGARETARRTGLNVNTIMARAWRCGWKKVTQSPQSICNQSPADALQVTLSEAKANSTVALATYTERASRQAAKHGKPLDIARKVRDVSAVYGQLWPQERHEEIIQASILLNPDQVIDAETGEESAGQGRGVVKSTRKRVSGRK